MKYAVIMTTIGVLGCRVEVEASSPEDAVNEAKKADAEGNIVWEHKGTCNFGYLEHILDNRTDMLDVISIKEIN